MHEYDMFSFTFFFNLEQLLIYNSCVNIILCVWLFVKAFVCVGTCINTCSCVNIYYKHLFH